MLMETSDLSFPNLHPLHLSPPLEPGEDLQLVLKYGLDTH